MNIDHAFERKAALERRLALAAAHDFTRPAMWEYGRECSASASGHSTPNYRGHCGYCGKRLGFVSRPCPSSRPDFDIEDVIDPVTLSPVQACERMDAWQGLLYPGRGGRRWAS